VSRIWPRPPAWPRHGAPTPTRARQPQPTYSTPEVQRAPDRGSFGDECAERGGSNHEYRTTAGARKSTATYGGVNPAPCSPCCWAPVVPGTGARRQMSTQSARSSPSVLNSFLSRHPRDCVPPAGPYLSVRSSSMSSAISRRPSWPRRRWHVRRSAGARRGTA
jgi:hypothetical protein